MKQRGPVPRKLTTPSGCWARLEKTPAPAWSGGPLPALQGLPG